MLSVPVLSVSKQAQGAGELLTKNPGGNYLSSPNTLNLSWRSPKNKSSPCGSAVFHGDVLRITQKGLYARTTIATVSFHYLPIDAPPWKAGAAGEGGATRDVRYPLISPKMMKNSYISAYP